LRLNGSKPFFSQINIFKELHQRIALNPPTFDSFLENPTLNRSPNVLCLDRSRVILSTKYGNGNYCHASYVDSYERKDGYVFSQAPFSEETEELFWRMVIDVDPKMIIVLGSVEFTNITRATIATFVLLRSCAHTCADCTMDMVIHSKVDVI
uniref:Tyrosine-protein phosphatase domain-containing protein n=1 Tax=Angiostrongylus cantonensis TaxID=6313 RepID=A0A158P7T0_ANGCA